MTSTTTASAAPAATTSPASQSTGSGPTSSPLLFFVALGFGVVFTNLWIIVGVKYCFRYNRRHRANALNENGEPIDLNQMPNQRRRRREKKLMSMEEVNGRFPLIKYKIWRSSREAQGLPAAGGVTAPPSRAPSVKDEAGVMDTALGKQSVDSGRPQTALSIAQQDHVAAMNKSPIEPASASTTETMPELTVMHLEKAPETTDRSLSTIPDLDEDEDDPIRTAAPPEMLAVAGDTCAICLDTLDDDDDVRGLTCGHAFHGSCIDPWMTTRRACCPLCKADYFVPKPLPEGEDAAWSRGRHGRHDATPQLPPVAWIGGRGIAFRPRTMFGQRVFIGHSQNHRPYGSTPARPERSRREQDGANQEPNTAQQTSEADARPSWRSRLPAITIPSMPRLGRRGAQHQDQGPVDATTDLDLEAGIRR